MPVLTFPFGALGANCHILHNGVDAVAVDPADDTDLLLSTLRGLHVALRAILLTHLHFDHTYGCASLHAATGLPVRVGKEDWAIRDQLTAQGSLFGLPKPAFFDAEILPEGPCRFGSLDIQVLHCPGHSPGSLCYYAPAEKALFSGDVLFLRAVGRSDLPGGDADELCRSIREKLYVLPPDTAVYCGHGENTSIGDERLKNMYCRA